MFLCASERLLQVRGYFVYLVCQLEFRINESDVCCSSRGRQVILASKETTDLIKRGMLHADVGVAVSAVVCITNLALPEEDHEKPYMCKLPWHTGQFCPFCMDDAMDDA